MTKIKLPNFSVMGLLWFLVLIVLLVLMQKTELSTLRITIEGDQAFVDSIKSLVAGTKGSGA
jgi:hypothetical protein